MILQTKKNLNKLKEKKCGEHFSNFGIFTQNKQEYIIMEKADMDLLKYINKTYLNFYQMRYVYYKNVYNDIIIKLLKILICLKKNYTGLYSTFTDFKLENILVFKEGDKIELKLGDVDSWGNNSLPMSSLINMNKTSFTDRRKLTEIISGKYNNYYLGRKTHWEKYHILRLFEIYLILKNKTIKIPECENPKEPSLRDTEPAFINQCPLSDIYNSNKDSFNKLKMNILEFLKENKHDEWIQFFNLDDDDILTYENLLNIFEGNIDNINYSKPPKPKTNETYLPWLQSLMIIIISFTLPYIIIKYVFMNKKGRKKKGGKSRKRLRRRRR